MHDNRFILFFIETGKLWCILYCKKKLYTCINYPLPGLVYIFCLQRFPSIFESTVECIFLQLNTIF